MQFSTNEPISQVQIPENRWSIVSLILFFLYNGSKRDTPYDAISIHLLMYILSTNMLYRDQLKSGTSSAVSHGYYFTSEQLFGPTGSLKQLDIAITAASIDASSPCFTHQIYTRLNLQNLQNIIQGKKKINSFTFSFQ